MNERGGDANGRGAVPEKTSEPPPSKVEALDGSNYEEWSGRMRSAFKRYKLLKIAVGEEKMPEEGEARERWIEKSAVLFDLILQSVNKEMFEHIKDLVEADDSGPRAWKLLRDKLTVSRDVKFLESLYYKDWKQQQQKLPSTPLIVEADEMAIVTAFLNGIILEEVYMKQPEGLDDGSGRVCRLEKAIYGLKQAPSA
ncbi:hypothetical protein CLOM_g918 [Closterium sp. NIES-68]|nr:hypothetical protein CLOM_g918 [Closterium sp. NIES-68]